MTNRRIHDLDDTATTLDSGAYIAVDSDSYTAAKKFAADSLQTAVDIGGLTPTDGNFIVGDGSGWVAESGATARTSLGLGSIATETETNYLLAAGTRAGATSGAQDFTNGLTVGGGSNGISSAGAVTGSTVVSSGYLYTTKSGTSNTTRVGQYAAQNATGDRWTAIGSLAGNANTSGTDWVAIGAESGYANESGSNWFAMGRYSGLANVSGSSWVGIGAYAGFSATGSGWVAIGESAAQSMISASYWTAIGMWAGRYTNSGGNATTNSNFVAIGYDARFSADGTSNEIVIGYQGRGNGSNTTTIGNSSTTHFYGLGIHVLPSGGAPASASATGTAGSIVWDSSYIYICTATDTWARVAIATW